MKQCPHFLREDELIFDHCAGTKWKQQCFCGGDRSRCTFYPAIQKKYANRKKVKVRPYRKSLLRKGGGVG